MECKKCHTDNPANAKFCRKCGYSTESSYSDSITYALKHFADIIIEWLKDIVKTLKPKISKVGTKKRFTLDVFKSIQLQPISVAPLTFINKFWLVADIILLVWIYAFYNISDVRYMLKDMMGEYNFETFYDIMPLSCAILGIISVSLLYSLIKKLIFLANSSYIEKSFTGQLVRIAKRCKLGLFDTKNKKVRLYSRYDSIEKFDDNHLVITRKGKKGIYSIPRKKIIVPVSFDSISSFSNSVCTATVGTLVYHFDIKGNRLN